MFRLARSAFLAADLKLTPEARDDHSAYIASWLKVLAGDKRAIHTVDTQIEGPALPPARDRPGLRGSFTLKHTARCVVTGQNTRLAIIQAQGEPVRLLGKSCARYSPLSRGQAAPNALDNRLTKAYKPASEAAIRMAKNILEIYLSV